MNEKREEIRVDKKLIALITEENWVSRGCGYFTPWGYTRAPEKPVKPIDIIEMDGKEDPALLVSRGIDDMLEKWAKEMPLALKEAAKANPVPHWAVQILSALAEKDLKKRMESKKLFPVNFQEFLDSQKVPEARR